MRRNLLDVAGRVYLGFMSVLYLFYFVLTSLELDADVELGMYWDNEELLYAGGMVGFIVAIVIMFIVNAIDNRREKKLQAKEINKIIEESKELIGEEAE